MGIKKAVAEKIISKEADYVLDLKGNQRGMLKVIFDEKFKEIPPSIDGFGGKEYLRGRSERRYYLTTDDIDVVVKK